MENGNTDLKKVIVFDVDKTLIKNNLTLSFISYLIRLRPAFFFIRLLSTFVSGARMIFFQLPALINRVKSREIDLPQLDKKIILIMKNFYKTLFRSLKSCGLKKRAIAQMAEEHVVRLYSQKMFYDKAIEKLKHHLRNETNIVVLLSTSMDALLQPLFKKLCKQIRSDNIDVSNRFFALGTSEQNLCTGSNKNKLLRQLLRRNGHKRYQLQFVYSDNNFMADLPLVVEAKHGGALICKKNSFYEKIEKMINKRLVFMPEWRT